MKGIYATLSHDRSAILDSSSSSQSQHRISGASSLQPLSRQPSSQPPHRNFAVVVLAKPPYIPKPDNLPQFASAPNQTINPPFRLARRILSKKVLPGGGINYRLGAFLPSANSVDPALPAVIQVSAEDIDNHVSYEELERFEHEELEAQFTRDQSEDEEFKRRQVQQSLQKSLNNGRGRPKKRKGRDNAFVRSEGGLLGSIISDNGRDSTGIDSDSSSSGGEGQNESSNSMQAGSFTNLRKTHKPQIRIEIPTPSDRKKETLPGPFVEGGNVKAKLKDFLGPPKTLGRPRGRPPKPKSVFGASTSPPSSTPNQGKATIHPNDSFVPETSKVLIPTPKASLITQRRKSNFSVFIPDPIHSEKKNSKDRAVFRGVASASSQNVIENLQSTSNISYHSNVPRLLKSTPDIDGEINDQADGGDLLLQLQLLRSARRGTARASGTVVMPVTTNKGRIRYVSESVGEEYSNSDDDVLGSHPPPVPLNSKLDGAQPCGQANSQRPRPSVGYSSSTPDPSSVNLRLSNNPRSDSTLSSRKFSKLSESPSASFLNIESEDDLAAGEQLLRKFQGQRLKSAESAETLLQQFKPKSSKQPQSTSPRPLSLVYPQPRNLLAKFPTPIKSASARKSSMTLPFPSGKSVQRRSAFRPKNPSNSRASKSHLLPAEDDDRFSSQKRMRSTYTRSPANATGGNDPDAEWRPPR